MKYKNFLIIKETDDFQLVTQRITSICVYKLIDSKAKTNSFFAFELGPAVHFAQPKIDENRILSQAEEIIKNCIDRSFISKNAIRTFEYNGSTFYEVNDPIWQQDIQFKE